MSIFWSVSVGFESVFALETKGESEERALPMVGWPWGGSGGSPLSTSEGVSMVGRSERSLPLEVLAMVGVGSSITSKKHVENSYEN